MPTVESRQQMEPQINKGWRGDKYKINAWFILKTDLIPKIYKP
jgi:hypothetical protein